MLKLKLNIEVYTWVALRLMAHDITAHSSWDYGPLISGLFRFVKR